MVHSLNHLVSGVSEKHETPNASLYVLVLALDAPTVPYYSPQASHLFQILLHLYRVSLVCFGFHQVEWSSATASFLLTTVAIAHGNSRPRVGK